MLGPPVPVLVRARQGPLRATSPVPVAPVCISSPGRLEPLTPLALTHAQHLAPSRAAVSPALLASTPSACCSRAVPLLPGPARAERAWSRLLPRTEPRAARCAPLGPSRSPHGLLLPAAEPSRCAGPERPPASTRSPGPATCARLAAAALAALASARPTSARLHLGPASRASRAPRTAAPPAAGRPSRAALPLPQLALPQREEGNRERDGGERTGVDQRKGIASAGDKGAPGKRKTEEKKDWFSPRIYA
jgi:hypothetical protein